MRARSVTIVLLTLTVWAGGIASWAAGSLFVPAVGSPFTTGDRNPRQVATGDFDEDGDPDIATANGTGSAVSILLNDGTGSFGSATSYSAGLLPVAIAVGLIDDDTHLDLALAEPSPGVGEPGLGSVLLGDGDGAFSLAPGSPFGPGFQVNSVAIGDLDQDGSADLAFTNPFLDLGVVVLMGDGTGAFVEHADSPFAAGDDPEDVAVGDVDGDGFPDVVVANRTSKDVSVLLGDGDGSLTEATGSPIDIAETAWDVELAHLDGDTDLDVAAATFTFFSINVLIGDGAGGFVQAAGSPYALGKDATGLAVGDFDDDGDADLATSGTNQDVVSVLLGDGAGAFTAAVGSPFAVGDVPNAPGAGDLNGDGRDDLAVPNTGTDDITVLLSAPEVAITCRGPGSGTAADDTIEGTSLTDHICGGGGDDTLDGAGGADLIDGQAGDDGIDGGPGDDLMKGRRGADTITDHDGTDTLRGGYGRDALDAQDGSGGDVIDGGRGVDTCLADPGDTVVNC